MTARAATEVRIVVTPAIATFDMSSQITVRGLAPGQKIDLRVDSTDAKGLAWRAHAFFVADRHGVADTSHLAPRLGSSYTGVASMGLLDSMLPVGSGTGSYRWGEDYRDLTFTVLASGRTVAAITIQRSVVPDDAHVTSQALARPDVGFDGQYYAPAPSTTPHAAVLALGGSEGGIGPTLLSGVLAGHGYPTLTIGYFQGPGVTDADLPAGLANIPLEYFAGALRWLRTQPGVDPARIWVLGISRGSEAALLLGVDYPDLVYGVAALVPSGVVLRGFPCDDCSTWTFNGQPVPYTNQFRNPAPTDNPAAIIPVERIRGPLFTICGGNDKVGAGCPGAAAIQSRRSALGASPSQLSLAYPDAGHGVGSLVPHSPSASELFTYPSGVLAGQTVDLGGTTPSSNWAARGQAWPRFLAYLANPT
jgi:dienelactone hydrolase